MTSLVTCKLSDRFAAVAPVGGSDCSTLARKP